MRHAVVDAVDGCVRSRKRISRLAKPGESLVSKRIELGLQQSSDVLQAEGGRTNLLYESDELEEQIVPLVVRLALPSGREALTRRAADERVDRSMPSLARVKPMKSEPGGLQDLLTRDLRGIAAEDLAVWEVELVGRGVNRVILHGGHHLVASLLEPEAHAPRSGEEVDGDRPLTSHGIRTSRHCTTFAHVGRGCTQLGDRVSLAAPRTFLHHGLMLPDPTDTTIDAGAEKRFFIEMLTKDIELLPAIVDLVDNSVDGARGMHDDGNLAGQWVRIEFGGDSFVITDNSGGISADVARHYAFRFGRAKDFVGVRRSVGQFGVGMKRAIFKIGQAFTVESTFRAHEGDHGDSRFRLAVDVEEWAKRTEWTFQFETVEESTTLTDEEIAGTIISVTNLRPSVAEDLRDPAITRALRTELRIRHQESIQNGLEIVLNDEEPLTASRPALQSSEVVTPLVKQWQIPGPEGGSVDARLYAGTVAPPSRDRGADLQDEGQAENFQDPGDAGWYLFCNDRLLIVADRSPLTGWGSPAAAYHPQYRNFRGFVYLSADDASLLPWNTTKTAVDRDSPVFRAVQSEMKTALVAVQAVINRAKSVRSRFEEDEEKPEILKALDEAPDTPITSLTPSAQIIVPAAPAPKPKEPATPKIQRIQYTVDLGRFQEVAEALGANSGSEVGRMTFDYFYDREVD